MNETALQDALKALLVEIAFMDEDDRDVAGVPGDLADIRHVRTYEEAMVLTHDKGLVFSTHDGAEFQLTINRSR